MLPQLKKYINLSSSVKIYIPGTTDFDQPASNVEQVHTVTEEFTRLFGGATANNAIGGYMFKGIRDNAPKLVTEKVTIITSFTDSEGLENHIDQVIKIAHRIKKEMNQEAVSIEVNNELYLI